MELLDLTCLGFAWCVCVRLMCRLGWCCSPGFVRLDLVSMTPGACVAGISPEKWKPVGVGETTIEGRLCHDETKTGTLRNHTETLGRFNTHTWGAKPEIFQCSQSS